MKKTQIVSRNNLALTAMLLAIGVGAATLQAQNLVNPSFEGGFTHLGGGGCPDVDACGFGYGEIEGWSHTPTALQGGAHSGVSVQSATFYNNGLSSDGPRVAFMELWGGGGGSTEVLVEYELWQDITGLTPGVEYTVSFEADPRAGVAVDYTGAPAGPQLTALIDGAVALAPEVLLPVDPQGTFSTGFHQRSFSFTATSSSHELTFRTSMDPADPDLNVPPGDPADADGDGIADFTNRSMLIDNITIVPEPTTAVLCVLALLGMAGFARHRKTL